LATKDAGELALDQKRLDLDKEKAKTTAVLEASRIASQNEQAQAKNDLAEAKAIIDATKERAEAHRDSSEAYRDDREDR
jgi:hypothetical protein